MADYQLTQTGDEVQEILDDAQVGKYYYNQTVTSWTTDNTYTDYPKKGTITLNGVSGTDGVEVTFSKADAISGNYAPICNTVTNGVEIWAKVQDNALSIPTIHIITGADVQLSGDDSYLPISGGNVTGSLTVIGDSVITSAGGSITGNLAVSGSLSMGGNSVLTTATGSKIDYIDCSITNGNGGQINSMSGGLVNYENFISCYVIGTNDLTPVVFTYSNLVYARLKNYNTMANADNGNYTLRVWYKVS